MDKRNLLTRRLLSEGRKIRGRPFDYDYILSRMAIANNIGLKDRLRASGLAEENAAPIIDVALSRLPRRGPPGLERFKDAISHELQTRASISSSQFVFLFPFNLDLIRGMHRKSFRVGQIRIKLHDVPYFRTISRTFPLIASAEVQGKNFTGYNFLEVKHQGRDLNFVARRVADIMALFISEVSFAKYFSTSTFQFGGPPKAHSQVLEPPVFFAFDSAGTFKQIFYWGLGGFKDAQSLQTHEAANLVRINRLVNRLKGSDLGELIDRALLLYASALSDVLPSNSFIKYWMAIELLALKDRATSYQTIEGRIRSIFPRPHAYWEASISRMFVCRHALVHDANFAGIGRDEVLSAKVLLEQLLNFVLSWRTTIESRQDLIDIYHSLGRPVAGLTRTRTIISKVIGAKRRARVP